VVLSFLCVVCLSLFVLIVLVCRWVLVLSSFLNVFVRSVCSVCISVFLSCFLAVFISVFLSVFPSVFLSVLRYFIIVISYSLCCLCLVCHCVVLSWLVVIVFASFSIFIYVCLPCFLSYLYSFHCIDVLAFFVLFMVVCMSVCVWLCSLCAALCQLFIIPFAFVRLSSLVFWLYVFFRRYFFVFVFLIVVCALSIRCVCRFFVWF